MTDPEQTEQPNSPPVSYSPYVVTWTRKDGTIVSRQYMRKYQKRPRKPSPPKVRPYTYNYTPKPKTVLRKEVQKLQADQVAQVHNFIQSLAVAAC
jgi:hypothetical protein